MPTRSRQRSRSKSRLKSRSKRRPQRRKPRSGRGRGGGGYNPTHQRAAVVLTNRTLIGSVMLPGYFYRQFHIVVSLASANADILEQSKFFQYYRILNVHIHWFNLSNVVHTTTAVD